MQHIAIAQRAGVTLDDLDQLFLGRSTALVARRLGVTLADIDDFIRGDVSAGMAGRLGFSALSPADEMARKLQREGRIGLLLGLLFAAP